VFSIARLSLRDMTACGNALRLCGQEASATTEVAERIVSYLYDQFGDPVTGERAFALVRFFQTRTYDRLPVALQAKAQQMYGGASTEPDMKCLTLLATRGTETAWNALETSEGHQVIPLPSPGAIAAIPMISQLISQFGIEAEVLLKPNPDLIADLAQRTYNVFHVAEAAGSPHVPAQQQFVQPYGIRSVLGFGGILPSGEMFALILFSRVSIPTSTANMFRPLAVSAKLAVMPFVGETPAAMKRAA
jgi:hypothetical protein